MKKKLLSIMIKNMSNNELYAFITATILEIRRRSGAEGDNLSIDDILSAVAKLITYVSEVE